MTAEPLSRWKLTSYCLCNPSTTKGHFERSDEGVWVLYEDAVADRAAALADLGRAMQGRIDALTAERDRYRLMAKIAADPDDEPSAGNVPCPKR